MQIIPVKVLSDNYSYLLVNISRRIISLIDPVDPIKVQNAIDKFKEFEVFSIFTTHHHWDHSSGNSHFKEKYPNIKVYGGDERVEALTDLVKDNDIIKFGEFEVKCIHTPCHTRY